MFEDDDVKKSDTNEDVKRAHFDVSAAHGEDDTDGNKAMDSRGITLKTTVTGKRL